MTEAVSDAPRVPGPASVDWDTFVSYRHTDREVAHLLAQRLGRHGLRVFFDERGIHLGADWEAVIGAVLRATRSCVVIVGATGVGGVQAEEIRIAVDRQEADPDFPLIVVLLPNASTGGPMEQYIHERSHLALRSAPTAADVERVANAIRGLGLEMPTGPSRPNPYPGLRPFDQSSVRAFFGRDHEVAELLDRLDDAPMVSIVGPSGTGKSSVLLAGVLPRLSTRTDQDIVLVRPGRRPRDAALRALGRPAGAEDPGLARLLGDRAESLPPSGRVVLAVDQLEEVVTRSKDAAQRAWLLAGLTELATGAHDRVVVVTTVRSDHLGALNEDAAFGAALARSTYLLGPLDDDRLREAIRRPAWGQHVGLQPGLVDEMLADLQRQPNALPLLAVTLAEMWDHRRGDRLTIEAYQAVGRVGGALSQRADAVVASASPEAVRRTLMRLVDVRPDGGATRRRRRLPELLPDDAAQADDVVHLLDALVDARLVVADDDDGVAVYELAHDTLLTSWARLAQIVRDDRRAVELRQRLTDATEEWTTAGRSDDAVLRGDAYVELDHAVRDGEVLPTVDERALLAASARVVRRARRRSLLLGTAAAVAVVGLVATGLVYAQRNDALANLGVARTERQEALELRRLAEADRVAAQQARDAEAAARLAAQAERDAARDESTAAQADRDAARAVRLLAEQRATGIRLAVDAAARRKSAATRQALALAMTTAPQPSSVRQLGRTDHAAVDPSGAGDRVLVGRGDGSIESCRAADATCGPAQEPGPGRLPVNQLAVTSNGRHGVLTGDGSVDVGGWRIDVPGATALALEPGGAAVVVGTASGRVDLYQAGTSIGGPVANTGTRIRSLAVSPRGHFLAVVEQDVPGLRLLTLDGVELAALRLGLGTVAAVTFTDDLLVVGDGDSGDVVLWSLATPPVDGVPLARLAGHERPVVALQARGGQLVSADADGLVLRWDLVRRRQLGAPLRADAGTTGDPDQRAALAVGLSADGSSVIVVRRDGAVESWPADDRPAALAPTAVGGVRALAATPTGWVAATDDALVVAGGERTAFAGSGVVAMAGLGDGLAVAAGPQVRLVDPATGRERASWTASALVTALASSSDHLVVGTADGSFAVLDAALRPLRTVDAGGGTAVGAVAVTADGARAAYSLAGGRDARLLSVASGAMQRLPLAHAGEVDALAFSPDGNKLATGSDDRLVIVWTGLDGSPVPALRLVGHTDRVTGLAYDAASGLLVSSGEDGTVRLWADDGQPVGTAVRVGRDRVDRLVLHRDRPAVSALTAGEVVTVELADWPARLCRIVGPATAPTPGTPDGCARPNG